MNGVFKVMEHHTVAISHLMTWRRHGVSACWSLRRAEILIPRRGIQDPIRFHVGSCVFILLPLLIVSPLIVLSLLPLDINYVAYRTRTIATKRSPECLFLLLLHKWQIMPFGHITPVRMVVCRLMV